MRQVFSPALLIAAVFAYGPEAWPQTTAALRFDVVSIKRHTIVEAAGGSRARPDGTTEVTNQTFESMIRSASPVPVRQVVGYPDWVKYERYDVITKPPAGATPEQRATMMRMLFADRMMLVGHVEQRKQDGFALVVLRKDGRLGPQLKPTALDCAPRPAPAPSPPPPPQPATASDIANRCTTMMNANSIVSGGMTMDRLAQALEGETSGRVVTNRTGLEGWFALTLKYAPPTDPPGPSNATVDDAPEIFTALQEQLGLKLQPETTTVPVFVVDHMERPTEN